MEINKTCTSCGKSFVVTELDQKFYEKMGVPMPTLCPEERMRRRLAFRNERNLYHRKCDLSGKELITHFSPGKINKVYDQKEWWSDKWDALSYGMDFDFSRPFFEQFDELLQKVPLPHIVGSIDIEESNCRYTNYAGDNKNCYLVFDSDFNEDCQYGEVVKHSKNCIDSSYLKNCELMYECLDCHHCYNLKYSQDCTNCYDSIFLKNCVSCKNCFACVGLVQKEYYIFNKSFSKEEYQDFIAKFKSGEKSAVSEMQKKFDEFTTCFPYKYFHGVQIENSDGDYLSNVKDIHNCFDVGNSRDLHYCDSLYTANDCMDVSSFGEKIELVYESGTVGINCTNIKFCHGIVNNCSDITYSMFCRSSRNLFGCVGIKRGEYIILNKQYSKEEYEKLASQVIEYMKKTGEWGEYFPMRLSPYCYNECMSQEYFPLTKEEVLKLDSKWFESDMQSHYQGQKIMIPENIFDIDVGILKQILTCNNCKKNYKINTSELDFYKNMNIPVPVICSNCRYKGRMSHKNPRKLLPRNCSNCKIGIQSTYSDTRVEKVYCEECYLKTVY